MKLSIVTTLYRSAPYIAEFYRRMEVAARQISEDYEIIFTNDGSPDDSLALVLDLAAGDPRVRVVDLSRNFGHHKAFMAGLSVATGDRVFFIDVDLEEKPEWLLDFNEELESQGADVVYGVQRERVGAGLKLHTGKIFYKLFNLMSETQIPENVCTVRLMTRSYVDALGRLRDKNLFLAGNYAWTGYRQVAIAVDKTLRPTSSSYSLSRLIQLFLSAITSFSSYPLKAICVLGLIIAFLATLGGAGTVFFKLLFPDRIALGWPSVIVSVWFLGGIIIFFIGIVGIYIAMIYEETKDRPQFIIRGVFDANDLPSSRYSAATLHKASTRDSASEIARSAN